MGFFCLLTDTEMLICELMSQLLLDHVLVSYAKIMGKKMGKKKKNPPEPKSILNSRPKVELPQLDTAGLESLSCTSPSKPQQKLKEERSDL